MKRDHNGLEVLDREQCLALLTDASVARIGLSVNGVPVVLPVFVALHRGEVVFCSSEGTKLDAALQHATVAIEADAYDPTERTGWSVVVKGQVHAIVDPTEIERVAKLGLPTWTHDQPNRYLAISTDLISGRRLPDHNVDAIE
ncbi:MAG: pyridoxamine 5'-phosphate oxidase family protein [Acidimicrobiales bacterium]